MNRSHFDRAPFLYRLQPSIAAEGGRPNNAINPAWGRQEDRALSERCAPRRKTPKSARNRNGTEAASGLRRRVARFSR